MREFQKHLVIGVVIVGTIISVSSWILGDIPELDRGANSWIRIGSTTAVLAGVAILILCLLRRDRAPDFLRKRFATYFERHGFCFAFSSRIERGVFVLAIWYQNRYARPCDARVSLTTRRRLGEKPVPWETDVFCEGGAFGVAEIPWGIPAAFQGEDHRLDVHAHVRYPEGRGKTLRFQEGEAVDSLSRDIPLWRKTLRVMMFLVSACTPAVSVPARPQVTMRIPRGVAERLPAGMTPCVRVFWTPQNPQGL